MRPPTDEHRDLASCRHSHLAAVDGDLAAGRHSHLAAVDGDLAAGRHSHLAAVYLALGDDLRAAPPRRSVPRGVCALAAGVVLALAMPLAWVWPAPRDQPAATVAGKAAGVEFDDEDADGPWPVA